VRPYDAGVASFTEQLSGLAPWRRAATLILLVVAIVVLVLAVAGVIHAAAAIAGFAIVAASYLVGPRSPFFGSDRA
jgi:hypothetical protein